MNFELDLEIAPQQQREKSQIGGGSGEFQYSYLSRYRFLSKFLRDKPFSFSTFIDNQRDVENSDFFERRIIKSKSYGGHLNYKNKYLPLNFSYENTERDINRSLRADQYSEDEIISFYARADSKTFGRTSFDYTRNDFLRTEVGIADQKGLSDEISLFNTSDFGSSQNKNLTSILRYRDLRGTRSNKDLILSESLRVEHTDDLKTFYNYGISSRSVPGVDSDQKNFRIGLTHNLYESLVTALNFDGDYLNATNFDQKSAGISLSENYRKKIGPSLLRLGGGFNYEGNRRESSSVVTNIINETLTLLDSAVVTLNETNIDASTIVVTNSDGTTIYTENTDYRVVALSGARTEIRRVATGSITDGQSILADYFSANNPSLSFVRTINDFRLSLGFWDEGVTFYYSLRRQRYPNIKGKGNNVLEKVDDTIVGSEWQWRNTRFKIEYEDYDSDLTPYSVLRIYQDLNRNISPRGRIALHSSQSFMNFEDDHRDSYEIRADYLLRLSPSSVFRVENGYRWQKDKDKDLKNLTSKLIYRLNLKMASFESGYEYQKEDTQDNRVQNHFLFTSFKREF